MPVTLGTWYEVQLDLDVLAATAHSRITELATGSILVDTVTSLTALGPWDPVIDGTFDTAAYFGSELTALTTP